MGRKQKKSSSVTSVPHREAFQRMNYLFQAALASLCSSPSDANLSRFYIHTMRGISKRLVLRMDPSVKRMLCKSCDTLLVPGVTCTHRLRSAPSKHVIVKCLYCGTVKRFLSNNDYILWSEKPEHIYSGQGANSQAAVKSEPKQVSQSEPMAS